MRFAYLITAHENVDQLNVLLTLLDDIGNDIYVHIDKKSEIQLLQIKDNLQYAKLHVYKKYKVYWGDISQVSCQLFLLKEASSSYHDYYHLISGSDLPVKSNSQIQAFFKENNGKQLIHFESDTQCQKKPGNTYYYPFIHLVNLFHLRIVKSLLTKFDNIIVSFQRKIKINRNLKCGANWFSITHSLAMDIIKNEKNIIRESRFSLNMDEVYLQTYIRRHRADIDLYDSDHDERNYNQIMRYIDWDRGCPYTFHKEDFNNLIGKNYLWARKFQNGVDSDIIKMIYEYINNIDKGENSASN